MSTLRTLTLWSLMGCAPELRAPLAPAEVDVQLTVVDAQVDSGEEVFMELHTWTRGDWTLPELVPGIQIGDPDAPRPDLKMRLDHDSGPVQDGGRVHTIQRFAIGGPDGSYIVGLGEIEAQGAGDAVRTIEVPPVFVDIGVEPPVAGDVGDLLPAPPPPEPPLWPWVAAASGIVLAGGVAWWLMWHRGRDKPLPPPVPAHIVAREAWARARAAEQDENSLAQALSGILRVYLEDISGWPASARTTREIDGWLAHEKLLDLSHRQQARRILDATDRLKYAREGGGQGFFEQLDVDFEAVIAATEVRAVSPVPMTPAEVADA